jgi:UDP-N-acetylglucosamine 4-epimerase
VSENVNKIQDVQAAAAPAQPPLAGHRRAGFIGSNLVEACWQAGQRVTGPRQLRHRPQRNLEQVKAGVTKRGRNSRSSKATSANPEDCARACEGVDFVLHQAALGSVPRSIDEPDH